MKLSLQRTLLALLITGVSMFALAPAIAADKPKLILQITVDQQVTADAYVRAETDFSKACKNQEVADR